MGNSKVIEGHFCGVHTSSPYQRSPNFRSEVLVNGVYKMLIFIPLPLYESALWRTQMLLPYTGQFRPPIAFRTDLSRITTELWEIPVLQMGH